MANRVISDAEARSVIDRYNNEHPESRVEYDFEREKSKKIADKNWVLTAYDETSADSESPVATNESLAGPATDVSAGKISVSSADGKGNGGL